MPTTQTPLTKSAASVFALYVALVLTTNILAYVRRLGLQHRKSESGHFKKAETCRRLDLAVTKCC